MVHSRLSRRAVLFCHFWLCDENRAIADAHNVETVPAFLLLHKSHELWRQVGELTVEELKEVLDDFQ